MHWSLLVVDRTSTLAGPGHEVKGLLALAEDFNALKKAVLFFELGRL